MHKPILFKISITNFALESSWNNSAKPTWNHSRKKRNGLCFFPLCNLKYNVIFTLNVHGFGSMRKQNIEKPLPWLRTTCGVSLIADITVFCRIACPFEMDFELVTLITQSFCTYLDGVCRTQFFCYICVLDVGWVEHFSTIFRVHEAYSVTKMVNKHILQPSVRNRDI